jgi:hypothetical protein
MSASPADAPSTPDLHPVASVADRTTDTFDGASAEIGHLGPGHASARRAQAALSLAVVG